MMKITKKDYFRMLADVVANAEVENKEGLMQFIDHEIGLLEKKKSTNTAKKVKMDADVEEMFEVWVRVGKPVTATELIPEFAAKSYTNQKISALLKKLVDAERVVKVTEKKKSYFSVA